MSAEQKENLFFFSRPNRSLFGAKQKIVQGERNTCKKTIVFLQGFPSRSLFSQKIVQGERRAKGKLVFLFSAEPQPIWCKAKYPMNNPNCMDNRLTDIATRPLRDRPQPEGFPGFSAVLVEFSGSTAENSTSTADFYGTIDPFSRPFVMMHPQHLRQAEKSACHSASPKAHYSIFRETKKLVSL
ncbi:MAG: hypothetical protein IJZ92_00665 [Bacteroidaceae bacterium]|nr:hypothetical protein [Bacteroidaceae bacterium]